MSRRTQTLQPSYFEGLYANDPDPWKFASSDYERNKYAHTLAALPHARYAHALEVGCSIGILTRQLAERCDQLLAIEPADSALAAARSRCADRSHVAFERMFVPEDWPDGSFDLIVLSEVVYYLEAGDVSRLVERIEKSLAARGNIVLVHWTGETDYPLTGDEAAELFIACSRSFADVVDNSTRPDYRLDTLVRH